MEQGKFTQQGPRCYAKVFLEISCWRYLMRHCAVSVTLHSGSSHSEHKERVHLLL